MIIQLPVDRVRISGTKRDLTLKGHFFTFVAKKPNKMKTEPKAVAVDIFAGNAWECGMVVTLLGDAGIEAYTKDAIMGTMNPWWTSPGGAGPIRVMISSLDVEMAKPIVDQYVKNLGLT